METGRTTKKYSSSSSVITHIIKSLERFLHFTTHLAFSHIMTEIWALFVTSVDSSTSAATNGAALIPFISYLTTSPITAIKSFWSMFEKPENTADISKCLANLSSFAARVCKSYTQLPRLEEIELSSLLQNSNCCLARKQFTLMRSFKISRFSLTLALWTLIHLVSAVRSKSKYILRFQKLLKQFWFWMLFFDLACLLRLLGRFFMSQNPVVVHTFS